MANGIQLSADILAIARRLDLHPIQFIIAWMSN
jgi:hypothetical protein